MELAAPKNQFSPKDITASSVESPQQSIDKKKKSTNKVDGDSQDELRKKQLCYWYKEPYIKEHDRPLRPKGKANRMMWVYYEESKSKILEQQAIIEDDQVGKSSIEFGPNVNLSPLALFDNIQKGTSFRIRGTVNGQHCIAMLDTGATHNFINEGFVASCRLQTEDFTGFRVRFSNGYNLTCTRWICNLIVLFNDYELQAEFNMDEMNIVLGMKWLQDIGEFNLNVPKMEMKFKMNGRGYMLRGIADGSLHSISLCREKSGRREEVVQEEECESVREFDSTCCSNSLEMDDLHQCGVVVQFLNNPLLKFDARLVYANPLFELDVDLPPGTSTEWGNNPSVWGPPSASRFQAGLTEEFYSVYIVRSAYSFSFDPPVHDLHSMHKSCAHGIDSWYDNSLCAVEGRKSFQCSKLLPLEVHAPEVHDTRNVVSYGGYSDLLVVLMLVLQESVVVVRDILQVFPWDPSGMVILYSGDYLGTNNFREGEL